MHLKINRLCNHRQKTGVLFCSIIINKHLQWTLSNESLSHYPKFTVLSTVNTRNPVTSKSPSSTLTATSKYSLHLAHKGVSKVRIAVKNTPPPNKSFPPTLVAKYPEKLFLTAQHLNCWENLGSSF